MIQEDKDLLLKDLCARLPYEVVIQVNDWTLLDTILRTGHIEQLLNDNIELKPYLRPMSSMTDVETDEYLKTMIWSQDIKGLAPNVRIPTVDSFDWLNAHHFDYRGLIEKNLALDCTGLHIYN